MDKLLKLSRLTQWFARISFRRSRIDHEVETSECYAQAHYNKFYALEILQSFEVGKDDEKIEEISQLLAVYAEEDDFEEEVVGACANYTPEQLNKIRVFELIQTLCDHEDSEYTEASLRFMEGIWRRKFKELEAGMEDVA